MKRDTVLTSVPHWGLSFLKRERAHEPVRREATRRLTHSVARPAQTISDETLMARIVGGDCSAMHMLYARQHVRIYRFALRLVRDKALAEDVVSDVFLEVWRSADQFEGRSAVPTWLTGIARLKAFSVLKRYPEEELDQRTADMMEDPADDPATSFERKQAGSVLRECLSGLSPEHREILDLVYFHQKSIAEVAEIVGIPRNTVKTRMFHARKRLGSMLQAAGIR